jgi:geranylgeranyl pyrophosphate synthase
MEAAASYIDRAKQRLNVLENSRYRKSLGLLADYVTEQTF